MKSDFIAILVYVLKKLFNAHDLRIRRGRSNDDDWKKVTKHLFDSETDTRKVGSFLFNSNRV